MSTGGIAVAVQKFWVYFAGRASEPDWETEFYVLCRERDALLDELRVLRGAVHPLNHMKPAKAQHTKRKSGQRADVKVRKDDGVPRQRGNSTKKRV